MKAIDLQCQMIMRWGAVIPLSKLPSSRHTLERNLITIRPISDGEVRNQRRVSK